MVGFPKSLPRARRTLTNQGETAVSFILLESCDKLGYLDYKRDVAGKKKA